MKKKLFSQIGLVILTFTSIFLYIILYPTTQISLKIDNPLGIKFSAYQSINTSYTEWLQQEEATIWNELSQKIKLSLHDCQRLKKEWYEDYQKGEKALQQKDGTKEPISKVVQERINTILHDFNISKQQLPVIGWKENFAAAATDNALFINERELCKLPIDAQKFVVGHEIQHFIHKDNSTNYVVERFTKSSTAPLAINHPVNKLSRFHELRADIKAALHGPEYAQGYVTFTEILAKKRENSGITHPKNSLRFANSKSLFSNLRIT
jgi:hypothetical protein